jgi:transposase
MVWSWVIVPLYSDVTSRCAAELALVRGSRGWRTCPLGFSPGKKTVTSARRAAMDQQVAGKPRLTNKAMGMLGESRGASDQPGGEVGRKSMPFFGIDVGKRNHEAVILDEAGEQLGKARRFANTRGGAHELLVRRKEAGSPGIGALAATGHSWLALHSFLRDTAFAVGVRGTRLRVPLHTDAPRQSSRRKTKSDRRDCWISADLVRSGRGRATLVPDQTIRQLRELTRSRFSRIDQVADLKRKVLRLLDRVFPEYATRFTDVLRKSSRALLAEAAPAEEIASFDLAGLTTLLDRSSRGRFGEQKAREIKALAAHSLGVSFLTAAVRVEVRCLLAHGAFWEGPIADRDQQTAAPLAHVPSSRFLVTIKGLGATSTATIVAEIGAIRRFADPKKLAAFAGLDPSTHQSGQFQAAPMTLSKRGSPDLRRALGLAAHPARQGNPDWQEVDERKLKQGKCHQQALAAVAHRLLNRVDVVLKEQRPFVRRSSDATSEANAVALTQENAVELASLGERTFRSATTHHALRRSDRLPKSAGHVPLMQQATELAGRRQSQARQTEQQTTYQRLTTTTCRKVDLSKGRIVE